MLNYLRTDKNISWFQTSAVFWMLYAFFWVIPRCLNFICRRFGTLCLFHLHRQVGAEWLGLRNVGELIREKVWLENSPSQTFSLMNIPTFLKPSHSAPTCLWRWKRQSVPKRRNIKFRRRRITQKKAHDNHKNKAELHVLRVKDNIKCGNNLLAYHLNRIFQLPFL